MVTSALMIILNKIRSQYGPVVKITAPDTEKDLIYNVVDYGSISALTYSCVLGKTPALYPNRISGLILVRRNTHRWSDRKN